MATREQIARRLAETLKTADQRGQRLVFSGRRIDDTTVTMAGAPSNQMYVRYPDSSREETTVWSRIYGAGAPIWVGPAIDGGEEYKGPAWELGTLMYGDAYLTMVQPVVITELLPTTVGENNFKPGRLGPSQEGGTYIHVEAFAHAGGVWVGTPDLDLTANFPSDPDVIRRVGIYHDPADNTLHAFDGEEVYSYGEFTDADRALVPIGAYPVGAVYLTATTSISGATRFDDWRLHVARQENSGSITFPKFGEGVLKTLVSDVANAGSDRHLIVAAQSETTDNLIEVIGLEVGDMFLLRADAGDTITVKHDDAGATDRIILSGGADLTVSGNQVLPLVKIESGKVVQPVDENSGGGGGGGTVYTSAYASPPGSPSNGDWWLPSDGLGVVFARVSGAWVNRGLLFPFTQPSVSGASWDNQGSTTETDDKGVLTYAIPANNSGNSLRVRYFTAPATPWTKTVALRLMPQIINGTFTQAGGLCFRQSDGKLATFGLELTGAGVVSIQSRKWTHSTLFSADYLNINPNAVAALMFGHLIWLQIGDNGTNRTCEYSIDGERWFTVHSVGRTDFLTAGQWGFFARADASASNTLLMQVLSLT